MKNFLISFALMLLVLTGCEKVIDIDLNSSAPRVIIEATVSPQAELNVVHLSRSVNFNEDNVYPPITGAIVTVSDGTTEYIFTEREPGTYRNDTIRAIERRVYTLRVQVAGITYTAQTTAPKEVTFDSLWISKQTFFGQTRYTPNVSYQDPINDSNYYRFIQYLNGKVNPSGNIFDDRLTNGRNARFPLNSQNNDTTFRLEVGDRVTVDMLNIDKATYQFFRTFGGQPGPGGGAAPANPPTNISGDCLGYFGAVTKQTKSVVVVE
jgi:hypothetical protein